MEDNRREVDPSGQELIEGEQNGQTAQPLVANQNDQNVNSLARENKKRKKREADKRFRAKQKQKIEDIKRQLEDARANDANQEEDETLAIQEADDANQENDINDIP